VKRILVSICLLVLVVFSQFVESARLKEKSVVLDKIDEARERKHKDYESEVFSIAHAVKTAESESQERLDSSRRELHNELLRQLEAYGRASSVLSEKLAEYERAFEELIGKERRSEPSPEDKGRLVGREDTQIKSDRLKIKINRLKYSLETLESEMNQ
jgi:hypothetical protein